MADHEFGQHTDRDIAIVGMAGRFPGARDLDEFWANVRDGVESVSFFTEEQLIAAGASRETIAQPNFVPAGACLDDVTGFDAGFFGYTAREAETMDPQHRVFLETAWEALEHSGYTPAQVDGRVGVFGGAGTNNYLANIYSNPEVVDSTGGTQVLLGNELGFLASRVSYKLDLRGPSVSLRSACSTSLVAVHLACRSLREGECDMALSGGVFINAEHNQGYLHQEGSFLSPDGHCRPFDSRAAGTLFGSGAGVVTLKRLSDALEAGDTVYAVIKGSAVNNDGAVKVGFTAPAVTGQAEVVRAALRNAGTPASAIGYVEAHGTGTVMGDPIEIRALTQVYEGVPAGTVALGSLKSNIGHLDAAAGIAGLLKTVLSLWHETLPPTLHFDSPNPAIDFAAGPFAVQRERAPWPRSRRPRLAGVSAFGFGGSNAHVVLEEAPAAPATGESARSSQLLVLSARSKEALDELSERVAGVLRTGGTPLRDAAYTAAVGRHVFPVRRIVTGPDGQAVADALAAADPARVVDGHHEGGRPGVAFLLSGQGGQYPGMAAELYAQEPVFRQAVDACTGALAGSGTGTTVRDHLLGDRESAEAAAALNQTEAAQPALFVLEYALARMWESWGVKPAALLGHSLGELVAACLAGVFTLPDALRLVVLRGALMQRRQRGSMLNVVANRDSVLGLLPEGLSLAAHNGPKDCVVAGSEAEVAAFAGRLAALGIPTHPVATSHAFHSALMAPMVEEFTAAVAAVPRREPSVPFVSNVTGTWITAEQAQDPGYWGRQILSPVEFAAGVGTLAADPDLVFLEIGPGTTLSSLARRVLTGSSARLVTATLPHRRDGRHPVEAAHRALGQLWLNGCEPDWDGVHGHEPRRRVGLPTYPFQRQRYWLERRTGPTAERGSARRRPDVGDWFQIPSWERTALPTARPDRAGERWLVFTDAVGVGEAVTARLRAAGALVTTVTAGPAWERRGGGGFTIDPRDASHYGRLVRGLAEDGSVPAFVAHCWGVTAGPAPREALQEDTAPLWLGFNSLLLLSQALNGLADGAERSVWVVSNGIHDVIGAEPLMPLKATVLGPCRVLPREDPGLACRSIDIVLDGSSPDVHAARLVAEFAVPPAHAAVAHRGPHRWSQTFAPAPLPPTEEGTSALREDGVYLITGGTGGLGLALAAHLSGPGRKLALLARTPVPAEHGAERPGGPAPAGTLRKLREIRERGAEVRVIAADVCDPAQTEAAVSQVMTAWGRIDGVFHAAGVVGGGLAQLKTLEEAAAVMAPKVGGTLALERALAPVKPGFMVLFGSNSANVGDFGLVDYVAANCFLDAYARSRASGTGASPRVLTVDWGPWQEVGMAVAADPGNGLAQARGKDLAERGMAPADAIEALERALSSSYEPQLIVTPVDARHLVENAFTLRGQDQEADERLTGLDAPRTVHPRPEVPSAYTAPHGTVQRRLCVMWQELLGIEQVGVDDSFFDLGGSSLVAIQLISTVNRSLGTSLTVAQLYESLTIARLAALVDGGGTAPAEDVRNSLEEVRNRAGSRRQQQQNRMARSRNRRQQ
ncbi:type I polyketide synthase [Streptomyces koyangensis]|uniref:type I polyketide synthase n=1 Tax=Streptomyces koyangensis TaxID=188770 RepID=UPI00337D461E